MRRTGWAVRSPVITEILVLSEEMIVLRSVAPSGSLSYGKCETGCGILRSVSTYLHFPGSIACHPLGIDADCPLRVAVKSRGAEINPVCKNRVSKQVLNTLEGVTIEQERWLLGRVSSEGDGLVLPFGHIRQHLDPTP